MFSFGGLLRLLGWSAAIFGIVVGILRWQFIDLAVVGDDSMIPTLFAGDQVVIWRRSTPGFGDVTVCENPREPSTFFISRVLGKPGDRLQVGGDGIAADQASRSARHGRFETVRINGHRVEYRELEPVTLTSATTGASRRYAHRFEQLGNNPHHILADVSGRFEVARPQPTGLFLLGDNRTTPRLDSRRLGEVPPEKCHGVVFMRLRPSADSIPAIEGVTHAAFDLIR